MTDASKNTEKMAWSGRIIAVQPRIRLTRSFDERYHSYQGYVLRIEGICGDQSREFLIAVGEVAHEKHRFQAGMELMGRSSPVDDPRKETGELYKTSGLTVLTNAGNDLPEGPPFSGVSPDLATYRDRGHRRLAARTYETQCTSCIWGCMMPVEMIIDHWNPTRKQYRFETFCYGPKSCSFYRAGALRKVPGRKGMSYTEEDWVDEEATSHRD
ncbi:MAG TPA: hypothetical protein PLX02_12590 [Syntrophorhabdaceae bacterium]|nr:hypothetical protein [Syntrophorhabdaceae bacterium]HQM81164.1 hypothetical protein [Syntrophorhabdaceae bacterium]HQM82450.1 hypothetical protein [Syntrophorhabdaceae bacterium]